MPGEEFRIILLKEFTDHKNTHTENLIELGKQYMHKMRS